MKTTPKQAANHYYSCCHETRKEYQKQFGQEGVADREAKFNEWLAHELDVRQEIKKQDALKEIKKSMLKGCVNLTDVVDMVIENNGIIGVGLISMGQDLDAHCKSKI